jgi:putative endonuclease
MTTHTRQAVGRIGERLAAEHLVARGYQILERNFRTRFGELDLIARGEGCLVFCEVKTRVGRGSGSVFGPLTAVGRRKRAQLRRIAGQWLHTGSTAGIGAPRVRFDVIGITLAADGRLLALEHVQEAF